MMNIPTLTPALIDELGRELGGRDFSGENQQSFLAAADSRDIQAAPGNGKTTLLVAKLALLSRTWRSRSQGVCVISHTNAARNEVEKRLHDHPSASAFLSYPHFVGTVTSFIDRFVALPYLRGLGWSVQYIDDDVFAAIALSRWRSKPPLVRYAYRQEHALVGYLNNLELANDFECDGNVAPVRLKLRPRPRQPGPPSPTGIALEELKAEIVNDGYYRFGDMLALAKQALDKSPTIVNRLRRRFPLVLLDEAQDTNGAQLALLDRLFGQGVAFQKLGDQNQTLYEDEELGVDDYWRAGENVIPLNHTRRFGTDIADFSSRLTVRAPQQIESRVERPSRRILILFDDFAISDVLQTYAEEVRAHWRDGLDPSMDICAVASRHSPTRDRTGGWPKTLIDYCPTYRGGGNRTQMRSNYLCVGLRHASVLHQAQSPPADVAGLIKLSIVRLLRSQGVLTGEGNAITTRDLWRALRETNRAKPLGVQRLIRDQVLNGTAPWTRNDWMEFCAALLVVLGIDGEPTDDCERFLEFVPYDEDDEQDPRDVGQRSNTIFEHEGVRVQLGSVHSVKGKTVDAILALETEVYRGRALAERAMDLATVLPHAFGLENRDLSANHVELAAATNIFVAATRPRHVLALAMRREAASDELIATAQRQGWILRDLTIPAPPQP